MIKAFPVKIISCRTIAWILLFTGFVIKDIHSQRPDTTIIHRNDTIIKMIRPGIQEKQLEGRKLEDILEDYSDRNFFSRKLHEWLVKSSFNKDEETKRITNNNPGEYNGKQIAHIDIRHIPPFGSSIDDTVSIADTWLSRLGNNLRFETAPGIIRKTITFQEKETIDQTDISDSERLLRSLSFINDSRIIAWPHPTNKNAINISIYVQDRYPHALSAGLIDQQPSVGLINKNILGRGISFAHTLVIPSPDIKDWGFRETVSAENFLSNYVNLELDYSHISNLHLIAGSLEKDFILPEIKYAGGIGLNRSFTNQKITDYPAIVWNPSLNFRRQNFWMGRSFLLESSNSPLRSNIYITTRFMDLKMFNNGEHLNFIPDGKFYYAGLSFSRRGYYKNNLIHSFGRTEDVPYGSLNSLSYGYHENMNGHRHFLEYHYSLGKALIPSKGYLYFSGDVGSYFRKGIPEQGHLKLTSEYISSLISVGRSKLRNFFELQYVNGLSRFPQEYLSIDEDVNGLHRFDYNRSISGSEKIVLKTEQVFFTRLEPLGFKFAVFSFFDMAFLREDSNKSLFDHNPYYSFGGGLRIRNDNLVFNTLQIRLAIMPRIPDGVLPISLRTTGEVTGDFKDFIPRQPGSSVFY